VSGSSCLDVSLPASCVAPKHLYAENLSFTFFALTMGGGGTFDALICLRCEREFVAVYPTRHVCKQCTMLSIHPLIRKVAGRIGDVSLTFLLVPFVCFDYDRAARKRYLYFALLARGSLFRTFTRRGSEWLCGRYCRRAGNISETEDIVDRICSFV
jgi:hypothetical protein